MKSYTYWILSSDWCIVVHVYILSRNFWCVLRFIRVTFYTCNLWRILSTSTKHSTSARHAGSFDCLMTSCILITMDSGLVGNLAVLQISQPNPQGNKKRKMYAIKQTKIRAEYRGMLPRPRLDLSGTPGLRNIGLSPGSWQTSLGLGSMSRYSAQILICITY